MDEEVGIPSHHYSQTSWRHGYEDDYTSDPPGLHPDTRAYLRVRELMAERLTQQEALNEDCTNECCIKVRLDEQVHYWEMDQLIQLPTPSMLERDLSRDWYGC